MWRVAESMIAKLDVHTPSTTATRGFTQETKDLGNQP